MSAISMFRPMPQVSSSNHSTKDASELSTIQAALDQMLAEFKQSDISLKTLKEPTSKMDADESNRFNPMPIQTESQEQRAKELKERLFTPSNDWNQDQPSMWLGVKKMAKPWNNTSQNASNTQSSRVPGYKWSRIPSTNVSRFLPMPLSIFNANGQVYSRPTRVFSPHSSLITGRSSKPERVPLYERMSTMPTTFQTFKMGWTRLLPHKPSVIPFEMEVKVINRVVCASPEEIQSMCNYFVRNPSKINQYRSSN